jgi:hypothetical protein
VALAVESFDDIAAIQANGRAIPKVSAGKWLDVCFDRIPIPSGALRRGENEIALSMPYRYASGLESLYLLGQFGVSLGGARKWGTITALPERLRLGDICGQGLPFYSGKIDYAFRAAGLRGRPLRVRQEYMGAACAIAQLGEHRRTLAWPPYQAIFPATDSDMLKITLALTRRNTFGPLHLTPREQENCTPASFLSEGKSWTDGYVLCEQGLREPPQIYDCERSAL